MPSLTLQTTTTASRHLPSAALHRVVRRNATCGCQMEQANVNGGIGWRRALQHAVLSDHLIWRHNDIGMQRRSASRPPSPPRCDYRLVYWASPSMSIRIRVT
ncbi:hypothetical protein IF1G_08959 [Cordyceps javanica]|uniref:Uncharacterized protein n=1 Tax=Cordyceps javanica TaxID=43265 RepID=A0A545USK8_9HYPO|nr:hypothetical protein IF1G_08959 [Cordyceps javanica]